MKVSFPISRFIIEAHGGCLWATPDAGAERHSSSLCPFSERGNAMRTEPTVFVVDDDADFCEALRWLIESDGLRVRTYISAESFLEAYDPDCSGVLVLDVRLHRMNGLDLQQHLIDHGHDIPVIILTGYGDVPMAVRALHAGALGFLPKPVDDEKLIELIHQGIEIDAEKRGKKKEEDVIAGRMKLLTPRERQVLVLVVAGKATKQIAMELNVAEKTIEVHRKRIMRKMGVRSAIELARLVLSVSDRRLRALGFTARQIKLMRAVR
jgi:two-component system response regulator FixJ